MVRHTSIHKVFHMIQPILNFNPNQQNAQIIPQATHPVGTAVVMPNGQRNYCIFDQNKVDCFVKQKEKALPYLNDVLLHSQNETQITETLYILDRMLENGTKGIDKMYPTLSRLNDTQSPNIQTYLAGIYRKIQVPDAFGPLVKMLIQNSIHPNPTAPFDPNEEIGGAILSYLSDRFRNKPQQ